MTESEIAARLINALEAAANDKAGARTALVSVTIDMLARAAAGGVDAKLVRKTRTLVFMSAEYVSDSGARIATAQSVHKVMA